VIGLPFRRAHELRLGRRRRPSAPRAARGAELFRERDHERDVSFDVLGQVDSASAARVFIINMYFMVSLVSDSSLRPGYGPLHLVGADGDDSTSASISCGGLLAGVSRPGGRS
jgi:hypothetical protein